MPVPVPDNGPGEPIAREEVPQEQEHALPPTNGHRINNGSSGANNETLCTSPNVRICYLRPKPAEPAAVNGNHTNGSSDDRNQNETPPKPSSPNASYGMSISRSAWDPYPWVCGLSPGGAAEEAGLRRGDCLLRVGPLSLLGLPVSEVAGALRSEGGEEGLRLEVWNAEGAEEEEAAAQSGPGGRRRSGLRGPLPSALQRLSSCLSTIVAALECPVCLECPLPPPAQQCPNGHLLCLRCRLRSCRCPICRINLAPMAATTHGHPLPPNVGRGRCLLADEIHSILDSELGIGDSGGIRATKRTPPVPTTRPESRRHQNSALMTANRLLARIGLGCKAVSLGDLPRGSEGVNDETDHSRHPTSPLTSRILGRLTNGKSHSLENLSVTPAPLQNLSPSCENLPIEPPSSPMTSRLLSKIVMGKACSMENLADNVVVTVTPRNDESTQESGELPSPHLSDRLITRLTGKSFSLENISRSSSGPQSDDIQNNTADLIAVPRALDRKTTGIGL